MVLVGTVLPRQRRVLSGLDPDGGRDPDGGQGPDGGRGGERAVATVLPSLAAASGIFALIWVVVVILMIVRPGSTTGV